MNEPKSTNAGALADLRVLELGTLIAGPFCGQLLGDMGAEVIKIEAPGQGDPMRQWGPQPRGKPSVWWPVIGRNKKGITLDLRQVEGQKLFKDLVVKADIVIENFRPGTLEKWGCGWSELSRLNPRLILVRVSGYGQTGPYAQRAGYGGIGEAMGGLRYIVGEPDRPPSRVGISIGDSLAAVHACMGTLAALHHRERTGCGHVIDAAIYESVLNMMESLVTEFDQLGHVRERSGPILPRIAPSNVYLSSDEQWVVIAANHDTLWRRLATIMGQPELGEDERFATHHARGEHEDLLDEIIGAFAARHTAQELDEIVNGGGVVCAPVYTAKDVYEDPYFRERELLVEYEDEVHGRISAQGIVPKLSSTPGRVRQAARWTVGADTEAVLEELGVERDELDALREAGVV